MGHMAEVRSCDSPAWGRRRSLAPPCSPSGLILGKSEPPKGPRVVLADSPARPPPPLASAGRRGRQQASRDPVPSRGATQPGPGVPGPSPPRLSAPQPPRNRERRNGDGRLGRSGLGAEQTVQPEQTDSLGRAGPSLPLARGRGGPSYGTTGGPEPAPLSCGGPAFRSLLCRVLGRGLSPWAAGLASRGDLDSGGRPAPTWGSVLRSTFPRI